VFCVAATLPLPDRLQFNTEYILHHFRFLSIGKRSNFLNPDILYPVRIQKV